MNCKNCRQNCTWAGKERSEHGKCFVGYIPTTNADRIRAMSDEELEDIVNLFAGCVELVEKGWDCNAYEDCRECRHAWLRSEANGGE